METKSAKPIWPNRLNLFHPSPQVELSSYAHDCSVVKLQLKGQLHEVEKQLGQGKLLTMLEVHSTPKRELIKRV